MELIFQFLLKRVQYIWLNRMFAERPNTITISFPLYTLAVQNAVPARAGGCGHRGHHLLPADGSTIGVAVLGTVFVSTLTAQVLTRTAEATAGLPPAMRERIQPRAPEAAGGGSPDRTGLPGGAD